MGSRLSLDNFLGRTKAQSVPVVYYQILVFVGLASIYFESCFHKIESEVWVRGLGVWLPSSLPQFSEAPLMWLLDSKFLVLFLGYLTLFFEGSFVFLMWHKWSRFFLFIVGVGLHLGIYFVYSIPYFALAMLSMYWLLMPDFFFRKIWKLAQGEVSKYAIEPRTVRRLKGLLSFILAMQVLALAATPQVEKMGETFVPLKAINWVSQQTVSPRVLLLGMAKHEMFIDAHFELPKIEYKVDALIENDEGQEILFDVLGNYINGRKWVFWLFRLGAHDTGSNFFQSSVSLYMDKWIIDNADYLKNSRNIAFKIREREHKIERFQWEPQFAMTKKDQKWRDAIVAQKNDDGYLWEMPSSSEGIGFF